MSELTDRLMELLMQGGQAGNGQLPPRGYPSPEELGMPARGYPSPADLGMPGQSPPEGVPLTNFRANVKTPYGYEEEMLRHNGMLSASQTQYANDRPIQVFRPGIPNPIWGWGR